MKNPTSGDLKVMLDSVFAAQIFHRFIYNGWEVSTSGNGLAHAVIRGSVDRAGNHLPNYHYEDLMRLAAIYEERKLENPTIIGCVNNLSLFSWQYPEVAVYVSGMDQDVCSISCSYLGRAGRSAVWSG